MMNALFFRAAIGLWAASSVASCSLPPGSPLGYRRVLLYGAPTGGDAFSRGWRDGCDTALAIVGSGTLRLVGDKTNASYARRLSTDSAYEKGAEMGGNYCAHFLDYNSG
ncbi:MAG: hypothetical protein ABW189_03425 [Rickettsiales bacterium]